MHWLTCDVTDEFSSRCRAASVICCCTLQVVLTERRCGLHPDKIGAIWVAHSKLHLTGIVAGGLPVVTEAFGSWMIVYIAREANPNCCWILRTRRVGWDSHLQSYNAMQACKCHKKPKFFFLSYMVFLFFWLSFLFCSKVRQTKHLSKRWYTQGGLQVKAGIYCYSVQVQSRCWYILLSNCMHTCIYGIEKLCIQCVDETLHKYP